MIRLNKHVCRQESEPDAKMLVVVGWGKVLSQNPNIVFKRHLWL
jgi:hypothetical protein